MRYKILSIEAWANGEDGWTWNTWRKVGEIDPTTDPEACVNLSEHNAVAVLISGNFIRADARRKVRAVRMSFGDYDQIEVQDRKTGEPLYAFEPVPPEDAMN